MTTPVSNGKIVFDCLITNRAQVCSINPDGTGYAQLTRGSYNYYSHITADGTSIVFTSFRDGNGNIYVMNADGSGQRRLTFDPGDSIEPAPNRDGSKITYLLQRGNIVNICVMNGDGSGQKQLTHDAYSKAAPEFSPDGHQILFERGSLLGSDSQVSNLWLMNTDGSNLRNLTHDQSSNRAGSFSPDGRQIVFASTRGLAIEHSFETRLFLMNLDGSNVRRIPSTLSGLLAPHFSPDGQQLVFETESGALGIMSISGTNTRWVDLNLNLSKSDSSPTWGTVPVSAPNPTPTPSMPPSISVHDLELLPTHASTIAGAFFVTLSRPSRAAVTVHYATANGTATAGADYTPLSGALTFNPGQVVKTVAITVHGHPFNELNKLFALNLSQPTNAALDRAQAVVTIINADIPPQPPQVIGVNPYATTSKVGQATAFDTLCTDPNGATDMTYAYLIVGQAATKTPYLSVAYDAQTNRLYLMNDDGTSYLGGFAPGSAHTISNSYGTLNCGMTTVSRQGTGLDIKWNLTPNAQWAGSQQNLFLAVRDRANLTAGSTKIGTWTIQAAAP